MGSLGLAGIGQAGLVIKTNSDESGKVDKFSDEFTLDGKKIGTFGEFFAWKMKKVSENLEKLLKELKELYDLVLEMSKNDTYDRQALAANLSDKLKLLLQEYGLDLSTATPADILGMIKYLREKILKFGRQYGSFSILSS